MKTEYPVVHEYTFTRVPTIASCSSIRATYKTFQDSPVASTSYSWEFFSEKDLPHHFKKSIQLLEKSIKNLSDTTVPFTKTSQKQLEFMLQSCMHTRSLLDLLG